MQCVVTYATGIYIRSFVRLFVCLFVARQPPVGQGLLIIEAPLSLSETPHSVGLLWTSDQLVAETST